MVPDDSKPDAQPDRRNLLLEDWRATREEMGQLVKIRYEILLGTIAAQAAICGALLASGVDRFDPAAVAISTAIVGLLLIGSLAIYTWLSRHYHWLVTYLAAVVEPELGMEREALFAAFIASAKPVESFSVPAAYGYLCLWTSGMIITAGFPLLRGGAVPASIVFMVLLLSAVFIAMVRNLLNIRDYKSAAQDEWRRIRSGRRPTEQ